jgi:hypothetical protein
MTEKRLTAAKCNCSKKRRYEGKQRLHWQNEARGNNLD